ncbi:alginate O-acetyltransferase AlgX-related protein [Actinokineospora sp.]|uniref:alginate O-acetyltransferase AlgX-related protein n=1 Tax=Actinokineospora sp. TaxID=1872133 RepID=UPI003D6B0479
MTTGRANTPLSQERSFDLPSVHEAWLPKEHTLYRPRHGERQSPALVTAMIFFCTPLLLLVLGVRPEAFENRPLAAFPSPGQGWGFFTGFEPWAADNLPLRSVALDIDDQVSRRVFGEPPQLGRQVDSGPGVGTVAPPSKSENDRKKILAQGFPKVLEGQDDWLYLGYDILGACLPERPLDQVVGSMKRLQAEVERSGRQFVLMIGPDKTTMVPQYLPAQYLGSDCARQTRDEFWRRMIAEAGATDLRPALRTAGERRGAPVYSRLDTHWTYEGGLVMVRAIAEDIQAGVTAAWKATPSTVVERKADIPPLLGREGVFPLQNYNLAPDGKTVRSRPIDSAFREPLRLTQPAGPGIVNKKVALIGDSLTLFATPFLAGGFSDVTVVHSDTAGTDPSAVAKILAESDVVVVEAVERSLVGGINPVITDAVINAIASELAKHPRR